MSFRGKLFLLFAVVAVAMVVGSIVAVNNRFTAYTRAQLRDELTVTPSLFDSFQRSQMDNLISRAVNISTDPSLRGALSTGDRATIIAAAEQTYHLFNTDLFWVLDLAGKVQYRVDSPQQWGEDLSSIPIIQDVQNGYDTGDIWFINGSLYQISGVPIRSGRQILGILLIGSNFEQGLDSDFTRLTGYNLAFVRDDSLVTASGAVDLDRWTLASAASKEVFDESGQRVYPPSIPRITRDSTLEPLVAPFVEFSLRGQQFAGALFELQDASQQVLATGMVYQSLAPLTSLLARIQNVLLAVGGVATLLALLLTYFVARGLTSPINRLVDSSRRLGAGDLETAITVDSQDEIGTLASALDAMRISLKKAREELIRSERLSTIGRMASTITHDFRQPITTIYGFMQLASLPTTSQEKREEFSQRVLRQIERMQSMITELLDFAKGEVVLNRSQVDLSVFLREIVSNFEQDYRAREIRIRCTCNWDGELLIDRGRIERVIENIVRNAYQAIETTTGSGLVQIAVDPIGDGQAVRLRIIDNGPGIPAELREHLFVPFFTHGKHGGTGLGLSVAARVVEEHGGEIRVESRLGEGTTFEIRLPAMIPSEVEA